eukprot:SAG11_NODE_22292_length_408_cov_2.161812_2_plen_54_part_01
MEVVSEAREPEPLQQDAIAPTPMQIDGISELEATNRMLYFDDEVLEAIPSQATI